jgi:hypothetical protein
MKIRCNVHVRYGLWCMNKDKKLNSTTITIDFSISVPSSTVSIFRNETCGLTA